MSEVIEKYLDPSATKGVVAGSAAAAAAGGPRLRPASFSTTGSARAETLQVSGDVKGFRSRFDLLNERLR